MNIAFILNGEDVSIQAAPDERLIDLLRDRFSLMQAKPGCRLGRCGSCSVIFNGKLVASCLVPAFNLRGGEVITMEGFSQTDEYQDIVEGFARAGMETCGYCDNAKIFACETLLGNIPRPNKAEITGAFSGVHCRCTNPQRLCEAVQVAAEIRQKRLYGRS